jgi:AhpD family alkylhydroperoxidase
VSDTPRLLLAKAAPAAYKALDALSAEVATIAQDAGLDPLLIELIKLRTSQINGCAFCLRLHTRDALKLGESTDRLAVLPAWREAGAYFSPLEAAALELAEAITTVAVGQVPDEVYDAVREVLTDDQLTAVSWIAISMNAFNRVAITSRTPVRPLHGTGHQPSGQQPVAQPAE